jgi:hypothetical protein
MSTWCSHPNHGVGETKEVIDRETPDRVVDPKGPEIPPPTASPVAAVMVREVAKEVANDGAAVKDVVGRARKQGPVVPGERTGADVVVRGSQAAATIRVGWRRRRPTGTLPSLG